MNKKTWYAIIAAAIVVGLGIWLLTPKKQPAKPTSDNQTTIKPASKEPGQQSAPAGQPAGTYWEGTLKKSDNFAKGNIMLITSDRRIYLRSQRDFSSLFDKQVVVTYEGTLDSFLLGDITEKTTSAPPHEE